MHNSRYSWLPMPQREKSIIHLNPMTRIRSSKMPNPKTTMSTSQWINTSKVQRWRIHFSAAWRRPALRKSKQQPPFRKPWKPTQLSGPNWKRSKILKRYPSSSRETYKNVSHQTSRPDQPCQLGISALWKKQSNWISRSDNRSYWTRKTVGNRNRPCLLDLKAPSIRVWIASILHWTRYQDLRTYQAS